MTLPLYYYIVGTPLGVLGLIRWSFWLVRRIPAVLYRPVPDGDRLPISVVVPVYQEDPVVLSAAIESWLDNHVHRGHPGHRRVGPGVPARSPPGTR